MKQSLKQERNLIMPREESPYYRDLREKIRREQEEADSNFWSCYYSRHQQEIHRAMELDEEARQQEEIAESMRLQAINDQYPQDYLAEAKELLYKALDAIEKLERI